MSANHSLILFEGDVTPMLSTVFDFFDLQMTGNIETAKGLAEIWEYTNWPRRCRPRNLIHKGVLYNGTWTAILDREMNMILDQEKCEACAEHLNVKIFGYMIENVSGTCALYLYNPQKTRGLNIQNFEILEDFGEPLPQESGISIEEMLEDGTMRVSRRLGFSDSLFAHPSSKVLVVEMEDPTRSIVVEKAPVVVGHTKSVGAAKQPAVAVANRIEKPWWKLW